MNKSQLYCGEKRVPQDYIPAKLDLLFREIYYTKFKNYTKVINATFTDDWNFVSYSTKELMFFAYQKGQAQGFKDALRLGMVQDEAKGKKLIDSRKLKVTRI